MSRRFNGTSDCMQSAATVDLSAQNKISVSFWLEWDSYATGSKEALELTANASSNLGSLAVIPDGSAGAFNVAMDGAAGVYKCQISVPRPAAAGTYHHVLLLLDRTQAVNTNAINVYVNGVLQTGTSISVLALVGNFSNATLNVMARNAASAFGAGAMHNLSIHSGLLTAQQIASLKLGAAPSSVGTCLFWWPLAGSASPEPASVGGVNMTLTGTSLAVGGGLLGGVIGDLTGWCTNQQSNAGGDVILASSPPITSERLYHAESEDLSQGNPTAPSLQINGGGGYKFKAAVKAGAQTLSIDAKYAPNLTNARPRMTIRANPLIGVLDDIVGVAPSGVGWVTIGPLSFTPTADGVVEVDLLASYVGINNSFQGLFCGQPLQTTNFDNLSDGVNTYGFDLWYKGVPFIVIGQALPVAGVSAGIGSTG